MTDEGGTDTTAWRALLERWNGTLFHDPEVLSDLSPEVVASGWLGYPPASERDIGAAEHRLGVALPPSYRAFLRVTNGWRDTGRFARQIWPVDEIAPYIERHRDLVEAWMDGESTYGLPVPVPDEQYFDYGPGQQAYTMRSEYLPYTLEISDVDDGVYLLNPKVVTPNGEWEAWFFAYWMPGAVRYRSFWDLMRAEYENYLSLKSDLERNRDRR